MKTVIATFALIASTFAVGCIADAGSDEKDPCANGGADCPIVAVPDAAEVPCADGGASCPIWTPPSMLGR